jgi:hypothetical protein
VSPTPDLDSTSTNDTGQGTRLFYDVRDGLRKARENCALVNDTCNVTLNLLNGDHFLFRQIRSNFYKPKFFERESNVMNLTIKPWYCDEALSRDRI